MARVRPRCSCCFGYWPIFQGVHPVSCALASFRDNALSDELLGTTYLIRIDIGIFLTAVWVGVILLHALLLDRRLRLNLIVASNLLLGVVVMHLPFIYDAYHRHFLQPFAGQYSNVAALILNRLLAQPTQMVANNQDQTRVAPGRAPAVTKVENANDKNQTGAQGPTPAVTAVENHPVNVSKPATFLLPTKAQAGRN